MKINYEKYPILEKLDKGIFGVIGMSESDSKIIPMHSEALGLVRDVFKSNIPFFKKSIKLITKPLWEAMIISRTKLISSDVLMEMGSASGTYLVGDYAYCFNIESTPGKDEWNFVFYAFAGNQLHAMKAYLPGYANELFYGSSLGSNNPDPSIPERYEYVKALFSNLICLINFLKYADIEVKQLPSNRQIFDGVTCKYNNKSKYPIEIIDSTWFTTLIKSESFKVRGHFRLQPHGHGLTKKKLIWINDFQKEGYTRKAKILNQ